MNGVFVESGFIFDFSAGNYAFKADIATYNGLKAVDFIVETDDKFLFIEVKNPDCEKAKEHANRREFIVEMGLEIFPIKMSAKFKDSLLKALAKGKIYDKPIEYILFLECRDFAPKQRSTLLQRINSRVPKFSEGDYTSINRISVAVYNRKEFLNAYPDFSVEEWACEDRF